MSVRKYYVHRYINKYKKSDYLILIFIFSVIYIPLIILGFLVDKEKEILFDILILTVYLILHLCLLYYIENCIDYIYFEKDNIKTHLVTNFKIKNTYKYNEIKVLYIDDCPSDFIPFFLHLFFPRAMGHWNLTHGKYIIARDEEKNFLFICSYRKELWEMLLKNCKENLIFVMNEEEYKNFKEERKKLIDLVEKETIRKGMEEYNKIQNY